MYRRLMCIVAVSLMGCDDSVSTNQNYPPPIIPIPHRESFHLRCDSFMRVTREDLHANGLAIIYKDSFHDRKSYELFQSIISTKFKLRYSSRYQLDFESCIMPIMDSALAATFGAFAKDSLIRLAYHLTDSTLGSEIKK